MNKEIPVSRFEEFKDEVDHIDFVIPSEFNLVAEKTILLPTMLSSLKKNDRYLGQKTNSSSYGSFWSFY